MAAVLDAVVRDFDAVALDVEAASPGDAEERLGGLGREEDDFGGGGLMGHVVGIVDVAAPDAADVADGGEELVGRHSRGEVGEPESAVLLGGEMLGAGIGFGVHAVISSRELGRTKGVGAGLVGEDSRGSLLHYGLHGQEAMGLFMGIDVDNRRNLDGRRRRDRLSDRVSSGRGQTEDIDSKRLSVVDFRRSSRAEQGALNLREVERRVTLAGWRDVASHGEALAVMVVLAKHIRLREGLARKRPLRGNSLGAVCMRTSNIDGAVDDGRKLVLAGQKGRQTRQWVLMASNQAPVSVQRAPSKVRGILSLDVERH